MIKRLPPVFTEPPPAMWKREFIEENRVNQVVDRVNATGTTWLGTTMECAQCHSHKYDPFSQEEYFEMFAFFNNTPLEVENKSAREYPLIFGDPRWNFRFLRINKNNGIL